MFSLRSDWDFRSSRLFSSAEQKRARGGNVIDLTESNPTRCGFEYPPDLLIDPDSLRRSVFYEPDPKGLLSARQAIAQWYENQQITVAPARIVLTSGTSEAYSFLFRLLCNVGDGVGVPKPSYPLFEYLCRLNDVSCRHYRLAYDGEWHIELQSVEELLASNTKGLILVHPNNPTGSFVKVEERDRILSVARDHRLPLVVDEVFSAFPFDDDMRRVASFAGTQDTLTFTVDGLSKLVGLPQMKLAWIVVSGPADESTKALQRLELIADTSLSVGTMVQQALPVLLKDPAGMRERILNRVRTNYDSLAKVVSTGSMVSLFACEGAWNAVLRLPATKSDEEWALELLQRQSVLTHPGHLFDFELKSCIVVSLLPEPRFFLEGIKRILAEALLE